MEFELLSTEWDVIRQCLNTHFEDGTIRSNLSVFMTPDDLLTVPEFTTPKKCISWLEKQARYNSLAYDRPLIVEIISEFTKDLTVSIKPILDKIEKQLSDFQEEAGQIAEYSDPFQPILLRWKQPMIGREHSCRALKALAARDEKAIYLVKGEARAGKSYTLEIADSVTAKLAAHGRPALRLAYAEVTAELVDPVEAVMAIASSFVARFNDWNLENDRETAGTPPELQPGVAKGLEALAQWLLSVATNTGQEWWLVIDKLKPVSGNGAAALAAVPAFVVEFIRILARRIARLPSDSHIRLIVLGFDIDLAAEVAPATWSETLPLPQQIGQEEVRVWFRRYMVTRGGADEAAIDLLTQRVFATPPAADDPLAAINTAIREVLHALQ